MPYRNHLGGLANGVVFAIFIAINGTPNQSRETGMAHPERPLESAARYTRGGGPPAPDHDSDHATRAKRIKVEQQRLIQWAKENGKLGRSRRQPLEFGRGGEHQVYFQKRT
jgi:hypothetical protein